MKVIEVSENSHKKIVKTAKEAKMIMCELLESLMEQCDHYKESYDEYEDEEYPEYEEEGEIMHRGSYGRREGSSMGMRRGRRGSYSRRGRYAY